MFFFLSEKFRFLEVKLSIYLNRRVFAMMYMGIIAYTYSEGANSQRMTRTMARLFTEMLDILANTGKERRP